VSNFLTKKTLSPAYQELLKLVQRHHFCEIQNLEVRGGEPVFDPAPRVMEFIKIGVENRSQPDPRKDDFVLRAPVLELFEHLTQLGDGRIAVIEVRRGLPFKLVVERPASQDVL